MKQITIVGLGSGSEEQLTVGVWNILRNAERLYLRTEHHPVVRALREQGVAFDTFDDVYTEQTQFQDVYVRIADNLLKAAEVEPEQAVVYGVPGHPMVAEYTVKLLRERCPLEQIELRIMGGESFLDQAFLRFGFDPIDGFGLLDATDLPRSGLVPTQHLLIAQVYDRLTASDVKLKLMEVYPDDHLVHVGHALGVVGSEQIVQVPLYELDHADDFGNLSLVWVPKVQEEEPTYRFLWKLHEIVEILRSPGGCPWDREQTHRSIRKNLIEETYEVLETIDNDDPSAMCEELGDLLLQVMLHAQMEEEAGSFTIDDVVAGLNQKLVRRHPHVFGERSAGNAEEALQHWQEMKQREKEQKGQTFQADSVLDGVPRDIPALAKAWKLQNKAARVGFDWDRRDEVLGKVEEEWQELLEALQAEPQDKQDILGEMGDLFFALVNVCRFIDIDPEEAAERTNIKFKKRFEYIEKKLRLSGRDFGQTSLIEMETWWNEAKKIVEPSLSKKDFPS